LSDLMVQTQSEFDEICCDGGYYNKCLKAYKNCSDKNLWEKVTGFDRTKGALAA